MNGRSLVVVSLWLFLTTFFTTGLMLVPAWLIAGTPGIEGVIWSAALCGFPGVLTVLIARQAPPGLWVWATLAGMSSRMLIVLLGVVALQKIRPQLGLREFYVWLIVMYNVLLFVETCLMLPVKPAAGQDQSTEAPK